LSQTIRIGIDGRMFGPNPTGIPRYVWELTRALERVVSNAEFFVYMRRPASLDFPSCWHLRIESSRWATRIPSSFWFALRAGLLCERDRLDVLWGGTGLLPLVGLSAPCVMTVHDLVNYVVPDTMSFRAFWASRLLFRASIARADAVVANSAGTAARLHKTLGREVLAVVHPAVSSVHFRRSESEVAQTLARFGVRQPYLLSVATREPRKNLHLLLRVFRAMKERCELPGFTLVLAGRQGWKHHHLGRMLTQDDSSVRDTGYVNDEELAALYTGAGVFVLPSSYEGFGMPVLEARACGAPVVTTDLDELREAGGPDCVYIQPTEDGIRNGILAALARSRPRPLTPGSRTWDASARALAEVLFAAAGRHLPQSSIIPQAPHDCDAALQYEPIERAAQ
jgi:glycosyltransferase involved in cell wall biosynthesis